MQVIVSRCLVALSVAALSGAVVLTGSQKVQAMPAYAQQTGKACGYCHVSAGGGGALKPAGKKFQAKGHKL